MQVWCSIEIQLIRTQHPLNFVEGKTVTASFVGGCSGFLFCFVKSQDPKSQMKFERTPGIPANAGDGLAYGVACLKYFYSGLVVWYFVKGNFYWMPSFFSYVKFC